MKKVIILLMGVIIGVLLSIFWIYQSSETDFHIKLKADFCIDNNGFLKEGTLLKFDQSYPEGFLRYILYLNLPCSINSEKIKTTTVKEVIPYWLEQSDSICISFLSKE